jgi:hypothetical protein
LGFPFAADVDVFDDVWDCDLPGPVLKASGGGSGKAIDDDERPNGRGGGKLGAGGIGLLPLLKLPGSGGGGGPERRFHQFCTAIIAQAHLEASECSTSWVAGAAAECSSSSS